VTSIIDMVFITWLFISLSPCDDFADLFLEAEMISNYRYAVTE
jgi:hypothetical protein